MNTREEVLIPIVERDASHIGDCLLQSTIVDMPEHSAHGNATYQQDPLCLTVIDLCPQVPIAGIDMLLRRSLPVSLLRETRDYIAVHQSIRSDLVSCKLTA